MITWENIGLTNGWSVRSGGSYAARAGITEDGSFIAVAGEITHSPTTSTNPFEGNPIGTLPVKAPAKAQDVPVLATTKSTITSASLYVNTNGNLTLYGLPQGFRADPRSLRVPPRALHGMARVRSRQAAAWPLISDRGVQRLRRSRVGPEDFLRSGLERLFGCPP
jgi:hypothetical protein